MNSRNAARLSCALFALLAVFFIGLAIAVGTGRITLPEHPAYEHALGLTSATQAESPATD